MLFRSPNIRLQPLQCRRLRATAHHHLHNHHNHHNLAAAAAARSRAQAGGLLTITSGVLMSNSRPSDTKKVPSNTLALVTIRPDTTNNPTTISPTQSQGHQRTTKRASTTPTLVRRLGLHLRQLTRREASRCLRPSRRSGRQPSLLRTRLARRQLNKIGGVIAPTT